MSISILNLNIENVGRLIAKRTFIWQIKFLNTSEFAKFSSDRAIPFWDNHIVQLWQLGLLRAELIRSNKELGLDGLIFIGKEKNKFIYIDNRKTERSNIEWTKATEDLPKLPKNVDILFHPFKFYVLYHLHRTMKLYISPMQMLVAKGYPSLVNDSILRFMNWSSKDTFFELIDRWNKIASLAIVTEPFAFIKMFTTVSYPLGFSYTELESEIQHHWEEAKSIYQGMTLEELQDIHQKLCIDAENMDSNVMIHNIIRLSNDDLRLKLSDKLGGALYIRNMAETLRRGVEDIHNTELVEEDDARYGPYGREIKMREYGSSRLFDDEQAASEYLKQHHLDYGVRLRWYVEGATEHAALKKALNIYGISDIEIRNLRGKFVESKDSLSFRESLEQDMKSRIFSFISLDGDRSDNLRVVRKAAKEEAFLGFFFVSEPDFEFKNFSIVELVDVLWSLVPELHNDLDMKQSLLSAVSESSNSKDFFNKALRASNQLRLGKGEAWGEKLMEYALKNPTLNGEKRQVLEAFETSFTAEHERFMYTKEVCRVDPESGKVVRRDRLQEINDSDM